MHFLSLSLLLTFSAHNFSAPITTVSPENTPNSASITRLQSFQNRYLTGFGQLEPSFEYNLENNTKVKTFESKKRLVQKNRNLQKLKQFNFAKEKLDKLSSFVPIYIKENSQFELISTKILQNLETNGKEINNKITNLEQNLEQKDLDNWQILEKNNQDNTFQVLELEKNDKQNQEQVEQLNQQKIIENNQFWQTNLEDSDFEKINFKNKKKKIFGPNLGELKIIELGNKATTKDILNKILPKKQIKIPKPINPISTSNSNLKIPQALVLTDNSSNNLSQFVVKNTQNTQQNQLINPSTIKNKNQLPNQISQIKNSQNLEKLTQILNSQNLPISQPDSTNPEENQKIETQETQILKEIKNSEKKVIPIPIPKNTQNLMQNNDLNQMIIERCQKYGCDAGKILKVVKCESGGRNITGFGGHIGPFQFTNRTFYSFAAKYGVVKADIWNVSDQVEVATQMFAQNLGKQHWSCF